MEARADTHLESSILEARLQSPSAKTAKNCDIYWVWPKCTCSAPDLYACLVLEGIIVRVMRKQKEDGNNDNREPGCCDVTSDYLRILLSVFKFLSCSPERTPIPEMSALGGTVAGGFAQS